jgi:hypothetical protein
MTLVAFGAAQALFGKGVVSVGPNRRRPAGVAFLDAFIPQRPIIQMPTKWLSGG